MSALATLRQWAFRQRAHWRQKRDAAVEHRTALAAADMDSEDGDIQVARQRVAFNERIHDLLMIPQRSLGQELELRSHQRTVRRLDEIERNRHVRRETHGDMRMSLFGPVAPSGILGALAGVRLWMVFAGLFGLTAATAAVQSHRVERLKDDLDEAKGDLEQAVRERDDWRERAGLYAAAVDTARQTAQASADALERERAAQRRAAVRERQRQREIQNVLRGSADPPDWGLRDNDALSSEPGPND